MSTAGLHGDAAQRVRHADHRPDPGPRRASGPARLLDLVPGRSAAALKTWLTDQPPAFCEQVEVIAMDGFGGYKTAATEELPEATAVMDPFHVVALADLKLDLCRQRIQQLTCGHPGSYR